MFNFHLGFAYHKTDENSQAIKALEKALTVETKQSGSFVEKDQAEALLKVLKAMPEVAVGV